MMRNDDLWHRSIAIVHRAVFDIMETEDIDVTREFLANDIYRYLVEMRDSILDEALNVTASGRKSAPATRIAAGICALKSPIASAEPMELVQTG